MSSSRNNYNNMTEIHTLSAADFKHTMQKNDLYDSNIDMRPDLAIISIGNSFMEKVYQEQKIKRDSLFEEAVGIISKQKTCKPAILQNRLAVGYQRACQILEQMESDGIVGPESKTGERKVLMEKYEKFKEKGL